MAYPGGPSYGSIVAGEPGTSGSNPFAGFTGRDWLGLGVAGAGLLPMLFGSGSDKGVTSAIGSLKSAASDASGMAKQFGTQSADLFGPVSQYLKQVTSGDRQAVLQATMPERRRVIDQYSTAKKAIAELSPRSGGQAAAGTELQSKEASDLATTTAEARQQAFGQAGNLATAAAQLGISEQALASGDLNSILAAMEKQQELHAQSAAGLGQALGAIAGTLLF